MKTKFIKPNFISFLLLSFSFFIAPMIFTSCMTRISYDRLRPSEINLASYKKVMVAVLQDFNNSNRSSSTRSYLDGYTSRNRSDIKHSVVRFFSDSFIRGLYASGFFEIIDPNILSINQSSNRFSGYSIPEIGAYFGADAVIIINLYSIRYSDTTKKETRYDEDEEGNRYSYKVDVIERNFNLALEYNVVDTGTGNIIATRSFSRSNSASQLAKDREFLPEPEAKLISMANSIIPSMVKQLAPYYVTETIVLMNDKADNPLMKKASGFVDEELYPEAIELYHQIWEETRNPAAGYNLSLVYESQQELDKAMEILDQVIELSSNKKLLRQKKRLQLLMKEAAEVATHY